MRAHLDLDHVVQQAELRGYERAITVIELLAKDPSEDLTPSDVEGAKKIAAMLRIYSDSRRRAMTP